jgi:alkylation response protein AidB-like acyl-CoA dehydrogenase
MTETLPDIGTTRRSLLDTVAGIAGILQSRVPFDEAAGTLSPETVKTLDEAGMFRLKLPAVLGGLEADPGTQILVLEALAHANPAAGWCTMVGATSIGQPGAFLADEAPSSPCLPVGQSLFRAAIN